ncbi:dephospho-CoA kinase [Alicyclobacillus hesperidum subsp. aegles]|uniref:dephospho-CoA kinase n=1 Tax=Alicyclobacillus hesperidum TaxID=89784 RepID=UPI0007193C90|nr:dephospho-CoA kinase [Alicyclobacillus hesperidum]KRW92958.1 dephospho-CoA kinase [Alicyclobacillus tengchongensis]GLG01363.1 dephospho-CoA kinase [Alicyclobacillus hesperidum subsp. aegles]
MKGRIVGLTGGIGSGKSTVTGMLRDLGAYVVDADVWARRVVAVGSDGLAEIVREFGQAVLLPDGSLNRKQLGAIVFQDAAKRMRLNAITHPRVQQGMVEETNAYWRQRPGETVIWDVPLLFEGTAKRFVDATIVVYASVETQIQRVMVRDGLDRDSALARIHAQMPLEEKCKLATYVIDNDGSIENTREQVLQVWSEIRKGDGPASSS